jgi:hypothetical protein
MKTGKEALATHLGLDYSELSHYSYQPGQFTRTVYAIDDGYYVAVKDKSQLPKPTRASGRKFQWREVEDKYLNSKGWRIYKA